MGPKRTGESGAGLSAGPARGPRSCPALRGGGECGKSSTGTRRGGLQARSGTECGASHAEAIGSGTRVSEANTRCGFAAVIGAPNAGKSTLVNHLVGSKVSIVTPKVQTTRMRVRGVAIRENTQIV